MLSLQLNTQLAHMKNSHREQAEKLKALEVQSAAFSSRFLGLVKQYTAFLRPTAATDRSLQDLLNQFDAEVQNGDVLRLLQLFPALLEQCISTCSRSSQQNSLNTGRTTAISNSKKLQQPGKWSIEKPHVTMESPTWPSAPHSKSLIPSTPSPLKVAHSRAHSCSNAAEREEVQLAEQLELIRGAFQSYKDGMDIDR